jgi:hypothetical protein
MILGQLGLVVAALFSGAAIYINVVEQPARLTLEPRALLGEWKPAYHNGTLMQAPLAVIGFLLGAVAWWRCDRTSFLVAALLMLANLPWTLLVIFPTNRALTETPPDSADASTRSLIVKWGRLHAVRSLLGIAATTAFFLGLTLAT